MKRNILVLATAFAALAQAQLCTAQDALADSRVAALRALQSVAIVVRPTIRKEILTVPECADIIEIALAQKVPALDVSDSTDSEGVAWLEVMLMTSESGTVIELSVYRWVKVQDSGEVIFAPVWSKMTAHYGEGTRSKIEGILHGLTTSFAADYLRANRRNSTKETALPEKLQKRAREP